jgi:quercetin dioxygenase-like cupin family protein
MNEPSANIIPPQDGKNYDWFLNRTSIKVSGKETGGRYTIIEEHIESGYQLDLHLHRAHTETCYILEGELEVTLGHETFLATPGAVIHVPPNTPHAAKADKPCRMLVIYSPAGFEDLLETYTRLTSEQFEDSGMLRSLDEQYDLITLPE